jgi:hypothetical protein
VDEQNNSFIYNFQTHPDEFIEWCGVKVISTPTYSQSFKFFREKYKVSPIITCYSELRNAWKYHIPNEGGEQGFNTYEQAELECLKNLIQLIK